MRTTPELIRTLKQNEIFVFGSNTIGAHGGGAALYAHKVFGAVWGQSEGMQGQSYAIPTCTPDIDKVPIEALKKSVDTFIEFAKQNPEKQFIVTQIGTGIAGWDAIEVAPLFQDAIYIANISLPEIFLKIIS